MSIQDVAETHYVHGELQTQRSRFQPHCLADIVEDLHDYADQIDRKYAVERVEGEQESYAKVMTSERTNAILGRRNAIFGVKTGSVPPGYEHDFEGMFMEMDLSEEDYDLAAFVLDQYDQEGLFEDVIVDTVDDRVLGKDQ